MELVSLARDVVVGVASVVVAVVAVWGLATWQRELKGKARFEVARNVMLLGFRIRQEFATARSPFTWSHESSERVPTADESVEEAQVLGEWYARHQRVESLRQTIWKLQEANWETQILLSDSRAKVADQVKQLTSAFAELATAVSSYFDVRRDQTKGRLEGYEVEWMRGLRAIIYGVPDDELSKQVSNAIDTLGSALRDYLE